MDYFERCTNLVPVKRNSSYTRSTQAEYKCTILKDVLIIYLQSETPAILYRSTQGYYTILKDVLIMYL